MPVSCPYLAALGDSITDMGNIQIGNVKLNHAQGYSAWMPFLAKQAYSLPYEYMQGVGGDRTDQIYARITSVTGLSPKPKACIVHGGTNDLAPLTQAQTQTNITNISNALTTADIDTIQVPIMARGGTSTLNSPYLEKAMGLNWWMRDLGRTRDRYWVADVAQVMNDPSSITGQPIPGVMSNDDIHPAHIGAFLMATEINKLVSRMYPGIWLPTQDSADLYNATYHINGNHLSNGMMLGSGGYSTIGSGQFCNNWVLVGDLGRNANVVGTLDFMADGVRRAQRLEIYGTQQLTFGYVDFAQDVVVPGNLTTGNIIEATAEVEIAPGTTGMCGFVLGCYTTEGGVDYAHWDMYPNEIYPYPSAAINGIYRTPARTLTATPTLVKVIFRMWLLSSPNAQIQVRASVKLGSVAIRRI